MISYELALEKDSISELELNKANIISELEVNRANVILGNGNTEAIWGTIQGDIDNQLDLIEKLDSISESIPDISLLATKEEVDTKANKIDVYTKEEIEKKKYLTFETDPTVPDWAKQPNKPTYNAHEVGALPDTTEIPDISPLATKEELAAGLLDKANKADVYTKSEIDDKGFLTEHQSLEDYALKTDIPDISNLATKDEVSLKANKIDVYDKTEIDEKFLEAGDLYDTKYYDKNTTDSLLAVKANIDDVPTKTSDITNDSGYINDVSDLATKEEISDMLTKTEASLTYQVKGEYLVSADIADLASKAELPTNISQLVNDSGYITTIPEEYITETELEAKGYLTEHQDISSLATKTELATKADTSLLDGKVDIVEGKSLIDDAEIIRLASITNYDDTEVKELIATKANSIDVYTKLESDSKYLTEHQSLDNYALKSEIPDISGLATKQELTNKIDVTTYNADKENLATKTEIPTHVSQLSNDSGYISSIPSEYVTETELASSLSVKADSATVYDKEYIDQKMVIIDEHLDVWDWAEYD